MAVHKRKPILDKLLANLKAANTRAGQNWYRGRRLPVKKIEGPVGLIRRNPGAQIEEHRRDDVNWFKTRTLQVLVIGKLSSQPAEAFAPDIEDRIDEFSLEIENAVEADPTLGGLVIDVEIKTAGEDIESADMDYGDFALLILITYRTLRTDASQP